MCSRIIDFYNLNKSMINGVDGLEAHFTDLHLMLISLSNEHHRSCEYLMPMFNKKKRIRHRLEDMLRKFITALDRQAHDGPVKKGKKKKDTVTTPKVATHDNPVDLIELYTTVNNKAKNLSKDLLMLGISKDDYNALEVLITQYVISLPVTNLLEEKIQQTHRKENKIMADMDYMLNKLIDPHMSFFSHVDTVLYDEYLKVRKHAPEDPGNKDRRDAYLIA